MFWITVAAGCLVAWSMLSLMGSERATQLLALKATLAREKEERAASAAPETSAPGAAAAANPSSRPKASPMAKSSKPAR